MVKQAPTPARLIVMVAFALSCFGILLFLWLSFGGPVPLKARGYRVRVAFPEATQLGLEADVREAGVRIGKVRAKELDPDHPNRTTATLEIEPKYAPLASDARVILRQKTLLGETYVEITGGSRTAPRVKENGWLADSQVEPTTQLDEIFQAFDPTTRKAFRQWQQSLAGGIDGHGADLNAALGSLPEFAASANDLLTVLDGQSEAVRRLVRNTGVVFGALSENQGALHDLIVNAGDVFQTTARRQDALADTFKVFPTFLDESKATFRSLDGFARNTDPLITDLRPVARDLRPTLADVRRLAPDLESLYRHLDPLITASRTGLPALRRTLDGLTPVLGQLQPFLEQLNPILQWLEYNQRTTADFIANGAGALSDTVPTRTPDERGHYLRQFGPVGADSAGIYTDRRELPTSRGNAYLMPSALSGPERARRMMFPNYDCSTDGKPGDGTYQTQTPDTSDIPSCWLQPTPSFPPGNTRKVPHIEAASYGK